MRDYVSHVTARALAGALVLVIIPLSSFAQKRGLMPADYYREVVVSDVALSPAGDLVAFTVTTVVEKENRRHREVWLERLRSGAPDGEPFRFTDPTDDSSAASSRRFATSATAPSTFCRIRLSGRRRSFSSSPPTADTPGR